MCGIAGFSGDYDFTLLDKMSSIIAHRGPDDHGTLYLPEYRLGLVHRRLSIIDLSHNAHQPMWDRSRQVAIIYNGELYNYKELRDKLIGSNIGFRSQSDTEVVLNLYLHDSVDMLSHLNGIFAFVIWDLRNKSLFLARDGIGVKPLYYSETAKGFIFASELKALLQESSVERTINPKAVINHLTFLWSPAPNTILKSVKKLEPGHALIVKEGRIKKKWKFYELPYGQPVYSTQVKQTIEKTQYYLKQAVRRQLVSDVPVGAFLSGGLDSSSVVALAKEAQPETRIQCFTIALQGLGVGQEGFTDDLPYAKSVAKYLDVDLHVVDVGSEIIFDLEKMIYHLDEPQADPAPLNALYISQLARKHGIKVLLSGAGGDDIFTGYRRHYALMQEKYWSWLPLLARKGLRTLTGQFPKNQPVMRRLAKAFQYAHLNDNERIASYFYWIDQACAQDLLSENLKDELGEYCPEDILLQNLLNLPEDIHPLNKMLYLECKHFLADHNLTYTDKMGMAAGVEVRVPLLDLDLISFAASLPVKYKQNGRIGKWIFKKAMEDYLPHNVIYRPKSGFGAPLRYWMQNEMKEMVGDILSPNSIRNRGIFNPKYVSKLIFNDRQGKVDAAYSIFALLCIELWCRIFIDKTS